MPDSDGDLGERDRDDRLCIGGNSLQLLVGHVLALLPKGRYKPEVTGFALRFVVAFTGE